MACRSGAEQLTGSGLWDVKGRFSDMAALDPAFLAGRVMANPEVCHGRLRGESRGGMVLVASARRPAWPA